MTIDASPAVLLLLLGPLVGAVVALGVPSVLARVPPGPRTAARATAALAAAYALACAAAGEVDPYAAAIFVAATGAALLSLAERRDPARGLDATDLAVWLLLWIPFDLRWHRHLFPGGSEALSYAWWSLALVVVAAIGFGRLRALPGLDLRLVPRGRDVRTALLALLAFGAIAIPVGLLTGFLRFPPSRAPTFGEAAALAPAIFLTIALPEEVYFRGILQAGLERRLGSARRALVIASLAFGLMHWNNAATLEARLIYVGLASVAGAFYGAAYRAAGLFAAALCHALVDLVWKLALD